MNFVFIFMFFLLQRKKIYTLKLIVTLNFSLLHHDICFQSFLSYFFMFTIFLLLLSISIRKYMHQTWLSPLRHDFCFQRTLLIHSNLVTQKISSCKNIYLSCKRHSFFCLRRWVCVNVLKYSIKVLNTNFIFIDVSRNDSNLIVGKMFLRYIVKLGNHSPLVIIPHFLKHKFWQNLTWRDDLFRYNVNTIHLNTFQKKSQQNTSLLSWKMCLTEPYIFFCHIGLLLVT